MGFQRYAVDFSSRPAKDSIEVRNRIDEIAFTSYNNSLKDVRIGEFTITDESELKLIDLPEWAVVRRL